MSTTSSVPTGESILVTTPVGERGEMDFPAVAHAASDLHSTDNRLWRPCPLHVEEFGGRRFRQRQEFPCWFDGEVWQVRGPFRVDFFAHSHEEAVSDLFDCLTMLWDVYVAQSPTQLTGDALELRKELESAIIA